MTAAPLGVLRWALKDSFLHYVRVIAAGTIEVSGGATETGDGTFEWPGEEAQQQEDGGRLLCFAGSVRLAAHRGFLDVDIVDPQVRIHADGSGILSIASSESQERIDIATLEAMTDTETATAEWVALAARLTEAGVDLFGTVYEAGTELAPVYAPVGLDCRRVAHQH